MNNNITDLTNDSMAHSIRAKLKLAQTLAREMYGENPAPEIVAAIITATSAETISEQMEMIAEVLEKTTADVCRAAAVAAGN